MKTKLLTIALGLTVLSSCSNIKEDVSETGTLEIKCGYNSSVTLKSTAAVDPNSFVAKIINGQDAVVKEYNPVSSAPDQIELMAGTYTVEAYSEEFTAPAFDKPVYGGNVLVDVVPGQNRAAAINCKQTNAGVKFLWTDEFKASFSEYAAKVTIADASLDYPKTETRTGYFAPGDVTIDITIGTAPNDAPFSKTITLNARELVTIKPVASDAGSGTLTVTITVDTDVTEREEVFVIGTGGGGSTGAEILVEDFATASGGTAVDASGTIWDGGVNFTSTDRVYHAAGSVKLGSSSSPGSMVTKALDLSVNGGAFTVSFKTRGWYTEDSSVIIAMGTEEKTVTFTSTGKAGDMVDASVDFTGGQANSTITIKTATRVYNGNTVTQRVFVDDLKVTETK